MPVVVIITRLLADSPLMYSSSVLTSVSHSLDGDKMTSLNKGGG
jgi:hypothetical protein